MSTSLNPQVIAASIAFGGVVVGLVGRDVLMALLVARQKRAQEIEDQTNLRAGARHDLVRLYADPLNEAAKSLRFRLDEIIASGQAHYLRADAQPTPFLQYKKISTLYRLGALLGWIRAFRRERSYLDPDDIRTADPKNDPIASIERALADGQHVEEQRLDELMSLWKVPKEALADDKARAHLASEIDRLRQEFLGSKGSLSPSDLPEQNKIELATQCATVISQASRFDIPIKLTQAYAEQASLFLGIKEAYIYRDWQSALGDMMILEVSGGPRRFDVIGYGAFEDRYLTASLQDHDSSGRRWFDRLQALFHDIDMGKEGIFDARRQQLKNLHAGCIALERYLQTKVSDLQEPSKV